MPESRFFHTYTCRTTIIRFSAALFLVAYLLCSPAIGHAQKTIVVIPKATILNFWKILCVGAHDAIKGQDINLIWRGPRVENKSKAQQHLLKFYTDKKVEAIVIAPADKEKLNQDIEEAVQAGIKVVIIDSPVTTTAPQTYIATDNYKAGELGAQMLAGKIKSTGPILLIGHTPENGASFLREKGFIDRINELLPGQSVIRLHMENGSERETRIAAGEILNALPSIAGIFAVNEPTSDGVLHVLSKHPDISIPFIAFDNNKNLVQGIKDGKVSGLIAQKPYALGFFGVNAAIDLIDGKKVGRTMESPVTVITQDNVNISSTLKCLQKMTEREKAVCPICFN
ncbi:substrate-binding domain-containing protein [Desulfovibrio sp. JC010]|uniref:substrate-binding domain-containing protein n=1 Tax=Desulfovibrio sp. JC010 TaxID=2593641 RepID=UPI0013D27E3F|nr:substrate-binding domain-containing protein [Desulfovibrio sp. JC010]NDV25199.1 substrate-binding domain-containing protein [Desulfovibrio sp. JC010]